MTQEALKLALEELADRFSEGWHEGIKIDASDIMLLNEAAQALAQTQEAVGYWKEHAQGMQRDYDLLLADYEKLTQPEQEPVAWQWLDTAHFRKKLPKDAGDGVWNPLYAAPQRTFVGLTDEEIDYIYTGIKAVHHDVDSDVLCRAIEAKLKGKNFV